MLGRGMGRRHAVGTGLLAALCCVVMAAAAQDERSRDFSAAERRSLLAGELVRRPRTRREGRLRYLGGTSFIRVRAPRDRVWALALDTSRYTRLIPGVVEARLVEDHGDRRVVYLRHQLSLVRAEYFADVTIDRDSHTVRFDLDRSRPHDVRAGRGFLTVDPYRGGREAIVTWGVMADPGSGIVSGIFGNVIEDWILRVPWCVRAQAEPGRAGC